MRSCARDDFNAPVRAGTCKRTCAGVCQYESTSLIYACGCAGVRARACACACAHMHVHELCACVVGSDFALGLASCVDADRRAAAFFAARADAIVHANRRSCAQRPRHPMGTHTAGQTGPCTMYGRTTLRASDRGPAPCEREHATPIGPRPRSVASACALVYSRPTAETGRWLVRLWRTAALLARRPLPVVLADRRT